MRANERKHSAFLDEEWLTPLQIARRFGYSTDKPIRKAIMRGELRATRAPCRRKLLVPESEVLRWIESALAFDPDLVRPERPIAPPGAAPRQSRRSAMPRLSYDATRTPSA